METNLSAVKNIHALYCKRVLKENSWLYTELGVATDLLETRKHRRLQKVLRARIKLRNIKE